MGKESQKSRSFRDLDVWKIAIDFAREIYLLTEKFPGSEAFGLTGQMRRSAISVPSNIAEGQGRNSSKEFRQFLSIALGSLAEIETQLVIAEQVGYMKPRALDKCLTSIDTMRKMIRSLSQSLQARLPNKK